MVKNIFEGKNALHRSWRSFGRESNWSPPRRREDTLRVVTILRVFPAFTMTVPTKHVKHEMYGPTYVRFKHFDIWHSALKKVVKSCM